MTIQQLFKDIKFLRTQHKKYRNYRRNFTAYTHMET